VKEHDDGYRRQWTSNGSHTICDLPKKGEPDEIRGHAPHRRPHLHRWKTDDHQVQYVIGDHEPEEQRGTRIEAAAASASNQMTLDK
jgi:hypothetical protein